MSDTVLKRLNVSDVFTIPYEANKLWSVTASDFTEYGILLDLPVLSWSAWSRLFFRLRLQPKRAAPATQSQLCSCTLFFCWWWTLRSSQSFDTTRFVFRLYEFLLFVLPSPRSHSVGTGTGNMDVIFSRKFRVFECSHCDDKFCSQEDLHRHLR